HYLGPKKSIAVVRIQGRLLVVGITNENINLISQLEDAMMDESEAVSADNSQFQFEKEMELLSGAMANPKSKAAPVTTASVTGPSVFGNLIPDSGVRNRIRSKLEGMKKI